MDIIEDSVQKLGEVIRDTGCEDGAVTLRRNPEAVNCQYEHGVCMEAWYGGNTGEFVTADPVEATTKISFMFGTPFHSPQAKGAACAVLNVLAAFLCLARGVRACPGSAHRKCLADITMRVSGKRVYLAGSIPVLERELGRMCTADPDSADVILISGGGLITPGTKELVNRYCGVKEILFIGPSTAGVAGLQRITRFCPYGT